MAEADYYAKQGDAGSVIDGVLNDDDGAAVPIAAATLRFIMTSVEGGEPQVAEAATNGEDEDEDATGAWSYTFSAEDLDTPGWFKGELEVTFSGGGTKTFPNDGYLWIRVTPDLD